MAYEVPDLPYDYNALEPHIDEETMHLHHDKHHQAYVDKANDALAGTEWEDKPVEEVLQNLSSLPDAFGSFDEFKSQFEANGVGLFGSGWTWLVLDGGALKLEKTPNQDSPV